MHITESILRDVYGKRDADARKGDFGRALVVGGSGLYSGAPALSALAALRSGCDVVFIAAPSRAADIAASFSPALITYPLKGSHLNPHQLDDIIKFSERKNAVSMGNGAGRREETMQLFRELFAKIKAPKVIDADAIYSIKGKVKGSIITPNAREFEALSGKLENGIEKRAEQVRKEAKKREAVIVLKGKIDIISDGKTVAYNKTGNAYMTKGGTGDTLAGIALSFLAQGKDLFKAGCGAAYVNGAAGDIAAWEKRQGLLPTDLIDKIPDVVKNVH